MAKYYVLKENAVPEVLIKVVEAKQLIEAGKVKSVQEATEVVGISRSSFFVTKSCIKIMSEKLIHYIGCPFNVSNSRFHLIYSFLTLYIYYIKNFKENQI